jgi:hypothetical protein
MENEGMKITVVGMVLIIVALIGAYWLLSYLARRSEPPDDHMSLL